MGFSVEPKTFNIEDIATLSSQISSIDAANDNVLLELETKGAVVPETYKQHTIDIFGYPFVITKGGSIFISTDGITWTQKTHTLNLNSRFMSYGNNRFITANPNGDNVGSIYSTKTFYSLNGELWIEGGTVPSTNGVSQIVYANSTFIAFNKDTGATYSSLDGTAWTLLGNGFSFPVSYAIYADNKFIVIRNGPQSQYYFSNDAITWSVGSFGAHQRWVSLAYGNGKFVAIGGQYDYSNTFAYSTNGTSWGTASVPSVIWQDIAYGNNKFVAVGTNDFYSRDPNSVGVCSTDGVNWTQTQMPPRAWVSVAYGNGKFVAVSDSSKTIAYSTDGITWAESSLPESYWLGSGSTNLTGIESGFINDNKTVAEILGVN